MTSTPSPNSAPRDVHGASPLGAVLAFSALASFAAGTATLSIFFVTAREPYSFTPLQQYALGLLVGVGYTLGALGASRVGRAFRSAGGSSRGLIARLSVTMAALVCLPLFTHRDGSVFVLLALYAPLTGCFWPLIEGYVSGGRRAGELRSAMGSFNVTWSLTLLASFFVPPLFPDSFRTVFVILALTHVASVLALLGFRREPGVPLADHHGVEEHAVPAGVPELLRVHRVLHAMSYLVMYALSPYLPRLLERLGLTGFGASALAASWLLARSLTFVVLGRWHGWHGRWSVAVVGTLFVLGGFGATLLAPGLGTGAIPVVAMGLFVFGAGLAALYTAALYYAFEVGGHEGGGSHEALIGLGYSIGPACGLLVLGLERGGCFDAGQRDVALLLVITVLCLGAALFAWRRRRVPSGSA
ncbi:MAG: MFS transporter [Planctomycetes bacterium]|nr:MFS transporter [Planctomycetota bacterium]